MMASVVHGAVLGSTVVGGAGGVVDVCGGGGSVVAGADSGVAVVGVPVAFGSLNSTLDVVTASVPEDFESSPQEASIDANIRHVATDARGFMPDDTSDPAVGARAQRPHVPR
jgi:hypothetical protein